MLDSKYLRQDVEQTAARLKARGFELDVAKLAQLEEQRKGHRPKRKNYKASVTPVPKPLAAKAKGEDIQPLLCCCQLR